MKLRVNFDILKEPANTMHFIGWREDHKDSCVVAELCLLISTRTILFITDKSYNGDEDNIQFLRGCSGGWTIYSKSDKSGVKKESLILLLAVQLI